jgi:thioredoxin reductase (NADPH)
MSKGHYDTMIVGAGPAGLTASIYARRQGLSTVVFGDTPGGNLYMIDSLNNYPGFVGGIAGARLGVTTLTQAQQEGAEFPMTRLNRLDIEGGMFTGVDSGSETYRAKTAIIACGVIPKRLSVANSEKKGIYFCSLCDGPLFRGKGAVLAVVGGGDMAVQEAITLARFAEKVILFHNEDRLKAETVVKKTLEQTDNIEVMLNATVESFDGLDFVDRINLTVNGEKKGIDVNGVFIAIGWIPRLDFIRFEFSQTGEGYIKTDEKMRTSVSGMFAAGDVRDTDLRQVITSCADGARSATYASEYIQNIKALS